MEEAYSFLIYLGILLVAVLIYKLIQYMIQDRINNRIKWQIAEKPNYLLETIQKNDAIDKNFLLTQASDIEIALKFIAEYQKELSSIFLQNTFRLNISFAKMSYEEYFIYRLNAFLQNYQSDYFNENALYNEKSRNYYDDNHRSYDRVCELTSYGLVYYKLRYMTVLFCQYNDRIRKYTEKHEPNTDYYSQGLYKVVEKKEITFCKYI